MERQDTREGTRSVFAKPNANMGLCAPRESCFSIRFDYERLTHNLEVKPC